MPQVQPNPDMTGNLQVLEQPISNPVEEKLDIDLGDIQRRLSQNKHSSATRNWWADMIEAEEMDLNFMLPELQED